MSPLRLAWLSLWRRGTPTLITILSIAVSVACAGILLRLDHLSSSRFSSLGSGWEAVAGGKAGGIEILLNALNGEGPYPDFLPQNLYESIRARQSVQFEDGQVENPNEVKSISPFLYFAMDGHFRAVGTDENFLRTVGATFAAGQWPPDQHTSEIILGSQVAQQTESKLGDVLHLDSWVAAAHGSGDLSFKVVGILNPTATAWDRLLYATLNDAQNVVREHRQALGERSIWGEHVLHYFFVNLQPDGFAPLQTLINKRTVGQLIRVQDERERLQELTGAGRSLGLFVSVFVLLLSSLSVSSMLITRFEAMGVQLAVLRAIGHSRSDIGKWLLWEGFSLGLLGVMLGAALDAILFPIFRALLGSALPSPEIVDSPIWQSTPVWLLALAAVMVAILIPLKTLYNQNVHQALRT